MTKRFPVPLCHRHVNLLLKELRRRREEALAAQRVVYYIRRGILVKIGTTQNMRVRMAELMPDEILATEPGGRELERERHLQFQAYRRRGEWFAPHPDLLAHIEQVRAIHGEPAMTGYPRLT